MAGYGARYWEERTSAARRQRYPALRGDKTADVVIIGGGLTGLTAAYVMAKNGLDVVLVERDRLASGGTAAGLGSLVPSPHPCFRTVESVLGRRRATAAWDTGRSSALEMAALLRRLSVRCELAEAQVLTSAATPETVALLKRERSARLAAGLDAPLMPTRALAGALGPTPLAAIIERDGQTFDPVRASIGLARAAEAAGARLFERSEVRRTTFTRRQATVVVGSARVVTRGVFVATAAPGRLFRSLVRHVRQAEGYALVTEPLTSMMKRETGRREAIVIDGTADAPRWLRWLEDGRVLFAGTSSVPAGPRQATKVLVQRTGQLMYELSLRHPVISGLPARWSWPVPIVTAPDGLPWVGVHRNFPFHFFAMAFGWHGDGLAMHSAKAALRHFKGESRRNDDLFGFGR
jgi:gamma-glutamylputrescine oxidase